MRLIECLRVARKVSKMFPEGCETGNKLALMLKGNCPVCVSDPIEHLSIFEYGMKYPARNTLTLGMVRINLCDYHLEQLRLFMEKGNQCPESFSEYYCGYEGCTWHSADHFCSYGERRGENAAD